MPKILSVTPLPNYKLKLSYDTSEIKTFDLSGKYSNASAKKYFKETPVDNAKNVTILDTVKNVVNYEIELEKLLPVLAENGKVIVEE